MAVRSLISKLSYAVLLSPLQQRDASSARLWSALLYKKSAFDRMMATVNLVDRIVPGIASRSSRWLYTNNRFPWVPVDIELIAYGTGAAVFKTSWQDGDKVLRIYRKSLGKTFRGLVEIADYYRWNYETVCSWYGNDIVLPMEFLVMQGFPLIGPVAASFQPYIHGQIQDFFDDFDDEELSRLMAANGNLRQQFLPFAAQTIRQWEEGKMCYDLVGKENLILVKQNGTYKLQIADVGIFKFDLPMKNLSQKLALIHERINRLAFLYESAKELQPDTMKA